MVNISIVEDDPADLAQLTGCLEQFGQEQDQQFAVSSFSDPETFLNGYRPCGCDLVFMDIKLPLFSGLEAARRLRETDTSVALVFVTNMEQCAVSGYAVDAMDFVVKPINYFRFSSMMRRALRNIDQRKEKEVMIRSAGSIFRLRVSQIYYVEIRDHLLIYHTSQGRMESWGKLSEAEAMLAAYGFTRCSSSLLVNLRHVVSVEGNDVVVAGTKLPISQRRKKAFYDCVTRYLSAK